MYAAAGHSGETVNYHFDTLTERWRQNNGAPAESTEDGPVRHRAPEIEPEKRKPWWRR